MHRRTRSEAGEVSSPRSSRAASFSSDRPSLAGSVTFQMPSTVRPAPAYIAASVASEIVTEHINEQLAQDIETDANSPAAFLDNALFSEGALRLLNAFLDHLLFAFLSSARSPSLTAIRPAITEVLKPRLAREAFVSADDELQGLLAGEDEEEFPQAQEGRVGEKWDVEKVWKRTRLRIMVYTRLGELEDEDEERYVQQERGLSMDDSDDDEAGLVSWASAIFLTSVVEYIAEQTLVISGQAAYARTVAKMKKMVQFLEDAEEEQQQLERIVVEDHDVEKVTLNSALGRLWRTWRKRVRAPIQPISPLRGQRSMSSFSTSLQSLHRRRVSHDTADESIVTADGAVPEVADDHNKPTETDIAAGIPLPMSDNDVAEIEVPGLARQFDEESSGTQTPVPRPQRPASFIMLAPAENLRRRIARERPSSMPPLEAPPFVVPQSLGYEAEFVTPMERMSDDGSYIVEEHQDSIHPQEKETTKMGTEQDRQHDADMVAFAASTGMGFGMSPTTPTKSTGTGKEEADTMSNPTRTDYDEGARVLESQRMSIERSGPPGVVRTFSSRSTRSSAIPAAEGTSYLHDAHSDDEVSDPEAIGVAHTSNVPIPTPSPPSDASANERPLVPTARQPERIMPEEGSHRHFATSSISARKTPSPEAKPAPPERSAMRKDVTPPKSRGTTLTSLQEAERWTTKSQEAARTPEKQQTYDSQRGAPVKGSPKHGSSRSREAPPVKRVSVENSPRARAGTGDGLEKATLKRVSSSSSTSRSASTSILHSARDSETSIGRPRGLSGRMSEEDREREFDSLVKGQETVKYTLTPQSMRDLDEPPVVRKVEPRAPASSVTVYPPVSADRDNSFGAQPMPARSSSRSKGHAGSPEQPPSNKKFAGPKPLAREPVIRTESMRDFADFIRTTGPAAGEENRPIQPLVSLTDSKSPNGSSASISGLGRKLSTKQSPNKILSSPSSGEGPSARPRLHMEPRSPAGLRSGNDDLIDFIRQGPPGSNNGQHRIPRAVAPFRTTVDSDQFDRMLDETNNESTYGSQVSTISRQSNHTSNSRTGLLAQPNVVQPAYSNTPQKLSGSMSNPEPQIQRTRRRIKDPYAIDSDDEDEDLLTALPKSSRRQEESLMDFLNSMEPPPDNEPKPFLINGATAAAARARLANASAASSNGGSVSGGPPSARNGASSRKPIGNQPTIVSSVVSDATRAHKPKLQARDPTSTRNTRTATDDLADFLRTSGPPEPSTPSQPIVPIRKEEGGKRLNAKFWRKKTYPDMP
ncbi:hypothetical protein CC78DRAFT_547427 [Lojkania enalia]|uniref:Flo11 n=1 Tax=Lojkania enalia TaxID=147567 RepID=A0A9P4K5Q0_9PLEO|nr:hypothetical protein CC78DRAFT_547427 [Didymosphaeria enalia]